MKMLEKIAMVLTVITAVITIHEFVFKEDSKIVSWMNMTVQNFFPQENSETEKQKENSETEKQKENSETEEQKNKKKDCEPSDPLPDCNKPSEQSK